MANAQGRRRKVITVKITADMDKLWSCKVMRLNSPEAYKRKARPNSSGQELKVYVPPLLNTMDCDSEYMWEVPEAEVKKNTQGRMHFAFVCEHQIDAD